MGAPGENLRVATSWMTTISLFTWILLGSFGCLCNMIIFTSKRLKGNSCAFYFLATAIFELGILTFGGLTRLAAETFGDTLLFRNSTYCKLRAYLISAMTTIATHFVLLAAFDRCMATSSHARFRAFSRIKVAHRVVPCVIAIGLVMPAHAYIFFDIRVGCLPEPGVYAWFYSAYLGIWGSLLPDALILVFTLWTLKNAKRATSHIVTVPAISTPKQRHARRIEAQLLNMMIGQTSISVFLDTPRVALYTYVFLTANTSRNSYESAVHLFIFQFSNVLLYLNFSKSFYVYTLASRLFRKIGRETIQHCRQKVHRMIWGIQVHPHPIIGVTD